MKDLLKGVAQFLGFVLFWYMAEEKPQQAQALALGLLVYAVYLGLTRIATALERSHRD